MNLKKFATVVFIPIIVFTANAETLEDMKSEYARLQEEEETKQAMLNVNYDEQDELKQEIAALDSRLSEAFVDIDKADKEIGELILKIDKAQEAYDTAEQKYNEQLEIASERIRFIYENGECDYFNILLEYADISEYLLEKQYVVDIMEYDNELLNSLAENEKIMKEKLEEITEGKKAKSILENFKTEKEFETAVLYEEKNKLLEEYRLDAEKLESELAEIQTASEKAAEIINGMEKNENFVTQYTGGELEWPVPGHYYVSSGYVGRMSPVGNGYEFHTGIDIPAPYGWEITAAGNGVVIEAGWINGYGNTVIINHGGGITTLYGHNSELSVKAGDSVKKGDTVALCGATGYATGNHCHFEVRINGEHTDPWSYLARNE